MRQQCKAPIDPPPPCQWEFTDASVGGRRAEPAGCGAVVGGILSTKNKRKSSSWSRLYSVLWQIVVSPRSYDQFCAVALALDHIGERWTLMVVRELLAGPARFGDLAAAPN